MKGLGLAAGIVSLIAGILEMLFAGLLSLYAAMFGMVAIVGAMEGGTEDAVVGGVAVVIMVVLLALVFIAALLHIVAAIGLLRNKPNPKVMWAAVVGSLIPMCTFYCAMTSLPAGIMLMIYLLGDNDTDQPDPDILV